MSFNKILFCNYNIKNSVNFENKYTSVPSGLTGSSVYSSVSVVPLYDAFDVEIGQIQFNCIKFVKSTFPALYNVTEEVIIELSNNTAIIANNYFKSNTGNYVDGAKYIIPIVSCVGTLVGGTGYIVIDVNGDNRAITIGLN
jgi:hypothetical protein